VEESNPERLAAIAEGLKVGAELSGVEIPGGELAQLPELIRGHPSPNGFDICAAAIGTVDLNRIVDGSRLAPGQTLIGVPSSGIHSNGLTLAREVLKSDSDPDARPEQLGGDSVADVLLEPTAIYVKAALELLDSDIPISGLFHLTGGGLLNLLRLNESVGFRIDSPLEPQPIFKLIGEWGGLSASEMYEVFNMGCGFAVATDPEHAEEAVAILDRHHPGSRAIGEVTGSALSVEVPGLGIVGDPAGLRTG
jgi:phosphoribosylformylglycinamidine cyclo-ligase